MPVTAIDAKTAFIAIDLQKGIVGRPLAHPSAGIVAQSKKLADAFRANGLPVVWVNVSGVKMGRNEQAPGAAPPEGWDELVADIDARPGDHRITKQTWGAFRNTGLEDWLRGQGVTGIVLAGIATSIGVESTARLASEAGFNVTLAIDAVTDMVREAHDNSVTRIFPRLGETGTTAEILSLLK